VNGAAAARLRELAAGASVEVTPRGAADAPALLPAGTHVYITALPGAEPEGLVSAAAAIRSGGCVPIPHISARSIAGERQLDELLGALASEAGVDDVLVIGGSVKERAGAYASSMDVLGSGLLERHGIRRAGVAGHPERSPDIPRDAEDRALAWKNAFALDHGIELRIVTQFALASDPYLAYERRIRDAGNRLPVIAGLPGVTSPATLLKYGMACGIGPSLEILRKKSGGLLKLATTRQWKPTEIAEEIAIATVADPASLISGMHLFPFGGLERTAEWLAEMRGAGAEAVTA